MKTLILTVCWVGILWSSNAQNSAENSIERKTITKELDISIFEGNAYDDWYRFFYSSDPAITNKVKKKYIKAKSKAKTLETFKFKFQFHFIKEGDSLWTLEKVVHEDDNSSAKYISTKIQQNEIKQFSTQSSYTLDLIITNKHLPEGGGKANIALYYTGQINYGDQYEDDERIKLTWSGNTYKRKYPRIYEVDGKEYSIIPFLTEFERAVNAIYSEL
jgi:hypothetical protein